MQIIVETFRNPGEPSSSPIRVRPVEGQGFAASVRVECSRALRENAPIGARFRLNVTVKIYQSGAMCLYSNPRDPWERVG